MFYDRFPDKPITLPLRNTGSAQYCITMPSYAYKGYLYYAVKRDSTDAILYLSQPVDLDSIQINVPRKTSYELKYDPE